MHFIFTLSQPVTCAKVHVVSLYICKISNFTMLQVYASALCILEHLLLLLKTVWRVLPVANAIKSTTHTRNTSK